MNSETSENLGGAVAIVLGPDDRTVLVRDPTRSDPKWKFPGGGVEPFDKDTVAAALRELEEETGLKPRMEHGEPVAKILDGMSYVVGRQRRHTRFVLVGITNFDDIKEKGNEGEEIRICNFKDIAEGKIDILGPHKHLLDSVLKESHTK